MLLLTGSVKRIEKVFPFGVTARENAWLPGPTGIGVPTVSVAVLIGVKKRIPMPRAGTIRLAYKTVFPSGLTTTPRGLNPTSIGVSGVLLAVLMGVTKPMAPGDESVATFAT